MINNHRNKKVIVYRFSDFGLGISKYIGTLIDYGIKDQIMGKQSVHWYEFRQYKKRLSTKFYIADSCPYFLIIGGWNGPNQDGIFDPKMSETSGSFTVSHGRYMSCDSRWKTDFDRLIDRADCDILFDHRHTKMEVKNDVF